MKEPIIVFYGEPFVYIGIRKSFAKKAFTVILIGGVLALLLYLLA
jgi:hypothetical protein